MTSLRAYIEYPCERDGSLQFVCPLNGCCREESASYYTKYQWNRNRHSEDVASTSRGVVRAFRILWKSKLWKFLLKNLDTFLKNLHQWKSPAIWYLSGVVSKTRYFDSPTTALEFAVPLCQLHFVTLSACFMCNCLIQGRWPGWWVRGAGTRGWQGTETKAVGAAGQTGDACFRW